MTIIHPMRQPINNSSRGPAYLSGRKSTVSAISCVEPSNIGEGRDGVDVSFLFSLRQRNKNLCQGGGGVVVENM